MVWVDVYCAVNFILDLLGLRLTALLTDCRRHRCALGALVGTAYAAVWLTDAPGFLFLLPCRIAVAAAVCLCAFGKKLLWLRSLVYIAVSAAFAGVFTALAPSLGAQGLLCAAVCAYGIFRLALRVPSVNVKNRAASRPATVELKGKRAEFPLFYDSGCALRDPISGRTAMIVSAGELSELLPSAVLGELLAESDPVKAIECSQGLLRPIFFTTADGRQEMLAAFLPERVTVGGEDKTGMLVALTYGLGENGIRAIAGNI